MRLPSEDLVRAVTASTSNPTGVLPFTTITRADCDAEVVLPPSSPLRDKIGSTVPRKFATPSKSAGLWGTRVVTGGRMISTISEAGNANRSPAAVNSSTSSVLDVEGASGIAQDFVL